VSAVAACWRRDGRSARPDDVAPSTAAAAHRARGPFHVVCTDNLALASTSPPWRDDASHTTVVVDGVIDNVADLARTLAVPADARAVALAAFKRWGLDAGEHLLGDFVVLIHDANARRLIGIRDPMGQRPLFYGIARDVIVLASEAHQIVRHPEMPRAINEGMIAEHLSDAPSTSVETLWRDVYRVPPGHALEISAAETRLHCYWDLDPEAVPAHATDDEHAEQFRELFGRAVACRVRGIDRVGVLLSGGIDSSSIAGVAQEIRTRAGESPVHAFSATFPGKACDESAYIDAVVGMWRLPSTRRDARLASRQDLEAYANRYLDVPMTPGLTGDVLRRDAAAMGIRTLLTGSGGDDFFSGSPLRALSMIRGGDLAGVARAVVSPLLSDRVRQFLRPIFGARPVPRPWIRSELVRRSQLHERLRARTIPSFATREQREIYAIVRGLPQILGDEIEDRAAHEAGVVQRHPFYDRRVAEFGFALPSAQRMQGDRHKVVVRHALRAHLPPLVLERRDKAEFSFVYVAALEAIGGEQVFSRLQSAERGWVDAAAAAGMYRRMTGLYSRGDGAYIELALQLWSIAALELWLERVSAITAS
jgi:asparagine synthase (glutamine-hydrolysing)